MNAPMHIQMVVHAALIGTVLLIVAYFIFATAQRSIGFVSAFGSLLGTWLILIAVVIVGGAITAPMFGGKPFGLDFLHHHERWTQPGTPAPDQPAPPAPDAPVPAPGAPPAPSGN